MITGLGRNFYILNTTIEDNMVKYIYDNSRLRCRLKYTKLFGRTELQLEKRVGFFFWVNCFRFITVAEDHWHGLSRLGTETMNPCIMRYQLGGHHEGWLPGTLNIKNRVLEFFKEYYKSVLLENRGLQKFESIS